MCQSSITRTHTHTHTHSHSNTHTLTDTHTHSHTQTLTHTHTHSNTHTHSRIHTHTHTHRYIHTHMHTQKHPHTEMLALTVEAQCCQHTEPAHKDQQLCDPSETHQPGTSRDVAVHQKWPYLHHVKADSANDDFLLLNSTCDVYDSKIWK